MAPPMKNLLYIHLLIIYSFLNAQERSYNIKSFQNDSKDTSTFVVDVKEEKAIIRCFNKQSHQPSEILLSNQKK